MKHRVIKLREALEDEGKHLNQDFDVLLKAESHGQAFEIIDRAIHRAELLVTELRRVQSRMIDDLTGE